MVDYTVPESIWATRPTDLYGRHDRDRLGALLWGIRALFQGFASASRWEPSRVRPVRRTHIAVITKRDFVAPDVVALTLADAGDGLLPSRTPGAHIDVVLPSGRPPCSTRCARRAPNMPAHHCITSGSARRRLPTGLRSSWNSRVRGGSCRQGFCGTCKVKVLAGQVDHRGRIAVRDDEMLVCVSRAAGDRVVIDA